MDYHAQRIRILVITASLHDELWHNFSELLIGQLFKQPLHATSPTPSADHADTPECTLACSEHVQELLLKCHHLLLAQSNFPLYS